MKSSDDTELLQQYYSQLLLLFLIEQLTYFYNSLKTHSILIVLIGELLDSIIVKNEISITDLLPAQKNYTTFFPDLRNC